MGATAELYLAVSAGAVLGSVARALVAIVAVAYLGDAFPVGTLFVNVVGSFVIGYFAALTGPGGRIMASTRLRQFVMTGFCGGFTTFSTFSLETLMFIRSGDAHLAAAYVSVSIVTWLLAVWLGATLAMRFNRM
ncbi:CrcB protein [Ancylobacter novellus DSM 506]|uniref:Fluoride-specific ion channel FluC n=1 Tax=Ancylobacter novellus (strain ATCC 8093 / DSM 506 / JCM 20403 / CCM 1077 / IAM 12100 / NBRC 12443 / NCIMB 10456) TaxID=639283 RepID=D7A8E4_ANCN5|nr:fluoride efflux transporter CrcB [Ancylobacter novellus]ADH88617.1 CrcB protein [Ancylobacter novellus DSM 506]